MKIFKQFITEEVEKLTHLEHLDDEPINIGIAGVRKAITYLQSVRNFLTGNGTKLSISGKWDGSPSLIVGTNPDNGKFFVATKSAFNVNPKLNYTAKDVEQNHPAKELQDILKAALEELPKLGIRGVLQGDFLFLKNRLKIQTYNGEKLVTFKPNTITYAAALNTNLGQTIANSRFGIVFHTSYSGKTLSALKASFGANVRGLKQVPGLFVKDAILRDVTPEAKLSDVEQSEVHAILSQAGKLFHKMDSSVINTITNNPEIKLLIKTFTNQKVRVGQLIDDPQTHVQELTEYIKKRYRAEIDSKKTEKAKASRESKLAELLKLLQSNKKQFVVIFEMQKLLTQAKMILLNKLNRVEKLGTFIQDSEGLRVTAPEGVVVADHLGNALKIVDRLTFSKLNFAQNN